MDQKNSSSPQGLTGGVPNNVRKPPLIPLDEFDDRSRLDEIHSTLANRPEEAFYFLDVSTVREKLGVFQEHFLPERPDIRSIKYAMKANPHPEVMKAITAAGIDGFDCASINEVSQALAHTDAQNILFNHPMPKGKDIQDAHQSGVRYFVIQSETGLERLIWNLPNMGPDTEIAVRMAYNKSEAAIDLSEKFGATAKRTRTLIERVRNREMTPSISINVGSQNKSIGNFRDGVSTVIRAAKTMGGVGSLNIGGGLPVNYDREDHCDLALMLDEMSRIIRKKIKGAFLIRPQVENKVIVEPGRSLVADAVELFVPIMEIDRRSGKKCAYISDGVFTSFSDRPIHRWRYNFDVFRMGVGAIQGTTEWCLLFGQTCDSGDKLGSVRLPKEVRMGDYLRIRRAGAYMRSQASNFNGFDTPEQITLKNEP